ncbi:MAG: hypothetical protein COA42_10995 [Alteromonadaceae bacterium]|nr:MAG: hypothetical protein COA42_10995 [Alteromonadaceae bacterium]
MHDHNVDFRVLTVGSTRNEHGMMQLDSLIQVRAQLYGIGLSSRQQMLAQEDVKATHVLAYISNTLVGGVKFLPYGDFDQNCALHGFIEHTAFDEFRQLNQLDNTDVCIASGWFILPEYRRMGIGVSLIEVMKGEVKKRDFSMIVGAAGIKRGEDQMLYRLGYKRVLGRPIVYNEAFDDHLIFLSCEV